MKIHLVVIDPQNDFCDPNGSLYVPGADAVANDAIQMMNRIVDQMTEEERVKVCVPGWLR